MESEGFIQLIEVRLDLSILTKLVHLLVVRLFPEVWHLRITDPMMMFGIDTRSY